MMTQMPFLQPANRYSVEDFPIMVVGVPDLTDGPGPWVFPSKQSLNLLTEHNDDWKSP